jgi:ribosomal protein S18 acetylase RimI-like enzyme
MQVCEASVDDLVKIAGLLVQLYEEEAPGMLTGPMKKRQELLARMLLHAQRHQAGNSYVVKKGAEVCGHVALATSTNPRRSTVRPALLGNACRVLGVRAGIRFMFGIAKFSNLVCGPLPSDTAQLHSLIVHPKFRGQGLALKLCEHVEQEASRSDSQLLAFVLEGNPALSFYRRLGYAEITLPKHQNPLKDIYRISGCAMVKTLSRTQPRANSERSRAIAV